MKKWIKEKEPHHLVLAFICFLIGVMILLVLSSTSKASDIPPRAHEYMDELNAAMESLGFPTQYKESIAGQIEQETCASPTHKKCWNLEAI